MVLLLVSKKRNKPNKIYNMNYHFVNYLLKYCMLLIYLVILFQNSMNKMQMMFLSISNSDYYLMDITCYYYQYMEQICSNCQLVSNLDIFHWYHLMDHKIKYEILLATTKRLYIVTELHACYVRRSTVEEQ